MPEQEPIPAAPLSPLDAEMPRGRFLRLAGTLLGIGALAACSSGGGDTGPSPDSPAPSEYSPSPEHKVELDQEAARAAEGMLQMAEAVQVTVGGQQCEGLRYTSRMAEHAGNNQTDVDVGAAGVGLGLLDLHAADPENPRWLDGATKTANWLMSVAVTEKDGQVHWPDYANDGDVASESYTSYDDGALGVGDFFWQLYEVTQDPEHKRMAVGSLKWLFKQAESVKYNGHQAYRWNWDANGESNYQMGMGEGVVGIVTTLAQYHQRLANSDPQIAAQCKRYIDGALVYINHTRQVLGSDEHGGDARALPETDPNGDQDGNTNMNAGYLSGAAGLAYMYLTLHREFGEKPGVSSTPKPRDSIYLREANKTLSWLMDANDGPLVRVGNDSVAWKLALDPEGGDDEQYATGFEEGAAGIGWVFLQAYALTRDERYYDMAARAGNWLAGPIGISEGDGNAPRRWSEDENPSNPTTHVNLNNGSAGIGMFLRDLAVVAKAKGLTERANHYAQAEIGAYAGIMQAATDPTSEALSWRDNDGKNDYDRDPSMHWGNAGIIRYLLHRTGKISRTPGYHTAVVPLGV